MEAKRREVATFPPREFVDLEHHQADWRVQKDRLQHHEEGQGREGARARPGGRLSGHYNSAGGEGLAGGVPDDVNEVDCKGPGRG